MTLIQQALARIEEMEKRAQAATPGPWKTADDAQGPMMVMHPQRNGVAIASLTETFRPINGFHDDWHGDDPPVTIAERNANTELIASACTDLPALCALVKALLTLNGRHPWMESALTVQELAALKAFVEGK